jgi:predicted phage terminase large subunit-like protein
MFFCPVAAPIQRPEAALPLDPYTLGLLLGDGCLDYTPSFTSIDGLEQSLVLPEGVHLKLEKKQGTDAIQAILTTGTRGKGEWNHNPLTAILRDLRLHGTRSHTKFIPSAYMTASPAQRLALLQGLLDTDGHNSGPSAVLSTVSETMADQAKELVESLGGVCAKHDYATSYTYKGEKKAGKRVFSLRMTFPSGVVPFRLRRKVDAFVSHPRQRAPRRAVVSIRPTGVVEECSCIEVSAPDHLYVTKHHVLTHNSKSLISSILYPAWDWIQNPWRKFIFVTYDKDLSYDFARRSMALMQSDWFRERWSDWEILGGDRASAGLFKNSAGGVRFSTMMGGAATGRHAHTLIVDDPIKPADLNVGGSSAKNVLDEAWTRWSETFCRRVADAEKFAKVCIMQRLHEEDLAGRMIKDPKTVHLCLPMRFEPKRAYKSKWGSDWRTEEGELLAPKRFPADYVDDIEHGPTGMTPRAFAAQMQQRPAPEAGALFMREWFAKRWEAHPTGVRWCMSVDASLKDNNDSDYGVIQVWAWRGAEFFLMDQHRARMAFSATVAAVKAMKTKWPLVGQILIEDKANGTAVVDTLKRSIPGVMAVTPEGGKFSRAQAVEPYFRAGNVSFPPDHLASWMPGLIEEFATFPVGSFDDSVDSASQALLFMSGRSRVTRFKAAMNNARSNLTANPRLRYRG